MKTINGITAFYTRHDYFSNHYMRDIVVKDITFNSIEQFMMYTKAKLFKDEKIAAQIMKADNCQYQKILGRKVTPYDEDKWRRLRRPYVYVGLKMKAHQHVDIRKTLLATGDTILVEASHDKIWGCGIPIEDEARWSDQNNWTGENGLGELWMQLRRELRG